MPPPYYFLEELIAFKMNPPIIAIGIEIENESGSRNAPSTPPNIVQIIAKAIIKSTPNEIVYLAT